MTVAFLFACVGLGGVRAVLLGLGELFQRILADSRKARGGFFVCGRGSPTARGPAP